MALRREAFARTFVPSSATVPRRTMPAEEQSSRLTRNSSRSAERWRRRKRAIDLKFGAVFALSQRNATTLTHARSMPRDERVPVT